MAAVNFVSLRGALRECKQEKKEIVNPLPPSKGLTQKEKEIANNLEDDFLIIDMERPSAKELRGPPDGIAYTDNFITVEEEETLIEKLRSQDWTPVRGRKVLKFQGRLPKALQILASAAGVKEADNCLCNFYDCGQGIFQHTDGPAYKPFAAALSLGQDRLLFFYQRLSTYDSNRNRPPIASVLLRRRSLIIFKDDAYIKYTHGLYDLSNSPNFTTSPPYCLNLVSFKAAQEFLLLPDLKSSDESVGKDDRKENEAGGILQIPVQRSRISLTFRCSVPPPSQ